MLIDYWKWSIRSDDAEKLTPHFHSTHPVMTKTIISEQVTSGVQFYVIFFFIMRTKGFVRQVVDAFEQFKLFFKHYLKLLLESFTSDLVLCIWI